MYIDNKFKLIQWKSGMYKKLQNSYLPSEAMEKTTYTSLLRNILSGKG